jgi:hypothetical protein
MRALIGRWNAADDGRLSDKTFHSARWSLDELNPGVSAACSKTLHACWDGPLVAVGLWMALLRLEDAEDAVLLPECNGVRDIDPSQGAPTTGPSQARSCRSRVLHTRERI